MRIALVILHADPARGGAERYTVDLAAALLRRGHEVSLLASSFASPIPSVTCVTIESPGLTRAGRYRSFLAALDAHLTSMSYDVVHAMLPVNRCDVYHPHAGMAAAAARKWNVALNPRRGAMARTERTLLTGDHPPITIALSQYVKRSILEHYPLPDERLATLFNAVDLSKFDPTTPAVIRERAEESDRGGWEQALLIANDFDRKGVKYAIAALAQMKDGPLELAVVGRPKPSAYKRQAHSLGVGNHVYFIPAVADPAYLYNSSAFFVLPTKHDPCSLVVLEALAMGLPVISTVFNGATEIMTDGVHGYVLNDPTDVDALADAMRKLLDPDRRRAMRDACLELRPKLSYEHHLDELMNIYHRAVAAHRK